MTKKKKIISHLKLKLLYNDFRPVLKPRNHHIAPALGLGNNKPRFYDFTLQHADSEGALLGERCSLQPAASVGTLTSCLAEPQADRPCLKDFVSPSDSLEQLSSADSDPKVGSSPTEGRPEQEDLEEEEEEGESYKEDILMGDDQVADFASSVLAAISCWHYKAKALLSTHFTTVRVCATHGFPTSCFIPPAHRHCLTLSLPRWV